MSIQYIIIDKRNAGMRLVWY